MFNYLLQQQESNNMATDTIPSDVLYLSSANPIRLNSRLLYGYTSSMGAALSNNGYNFIFDKYGFIITGYTVDGDGNRFSAALVPSQIASTQIKVNPTYNVWVNATMTTAQI
jgi:hypothetical protein